MFRSRTNIRRQNKGPCVAVRAMWNEDGGVCLSSDSLPFFRRAKVLRLVAGAAANPEDTSSMRRRSCMPTIVAPSCSHLAALWSPLTRLKQPKQMLPPPMLKRSARESMDGGEFSNGPTSCQSSSAARTQDVARD